MHYITIFVTISTQWDTKYRQHVCGLTKLATSMSNGSGLKNWMEASQLSPSTHSTPNSINYQIYVHGCIVRIKNCITDMAWKTVNCISCVTLTIMTQGETGLRVLTKRQDWDYWQRDRTESSPRSQSRKVMWLTGEKYDWLVTWSRL